MQSFSPITIIFGERSLQEIGHFSLITTARYCRWSEACLETLRFSAFLCVSLRFSASLCVSATSALKEATEVRTDQTQRSQRRRGREEVNEIATNSQVGTGKMVAISEKCLKLSSFRIAVLVLVLEATLQSS